MPIFSNEITYRASLYANVFVKEKMVRYGFYEKMVFWAAENMCFQVIFYNRQISINICEHFDV